MIIRWIRLVSVFLLVLAAPAAASQGEEDAGDDTRIPVGVLRINTPTGANFERGIKNALRVLKKEDRIRLVVRSYGDEREGLTEFQALLEQDRVRAVLGPTDSGVYVRILEEAAALLREEQAKEEALTEAVPEDAEPAGDAEGAEDEDVAGEAEDADDAGVMENMVPVVSSMVTAEIKPEVLKSAGKAADWIFRTNVSDGERVRQMADFVGKFWVSSCAVLYADNAYGERAEAAFRKALPMDLKHGYLPLQYDARENLDDRVRQLLNERPEAVGMFGSREEIDCILSRFLTMNGSSTPYKPIFFTILDARGLAAEYPGFHFLSLLEPRKEVPDLIPPREFVDEAEAISFDTARLVFAALDEVGGDPARLKTELTERLSGRIEGSQTGMKFGTDAENIAVPTIYRADPADEQNPKGVLTPINIERTFDLRTKLEMKVRLLHSCYGIWPFFNLGLILFAVVFFNILDLRRWYQGSIFNLLNRYSLLFIGVNLILIGVLYVYLAETGKVRYDSVLAASIIAVTPTALLRSTLFESPAGKSIGIANLYDRLLLWINDKLATKKFQTRQPLVNVLAYFNYLRTLRSKLRQVYNNSRDPSLAKANKDALDAELAELYTTVEKRRACARRLLRRFDWNALIALELVPKDFRSRRPIDPDVVIGRCVEHIRDSRTTERMERLEELFREAKQRFPTVQAAPQGSGATASEQGDVSVSDVVAESASVAEGDTVSEKATVAEGATGPKGPNEIEVEVEAEEDTGQRTLNEKLQFVMVHSFYTPSKLVMEDLLSPDWKKSTPQLQSPWRQRLSRLLMRLRPGSNGKSDAHAGKDEGEDVLTPAHPREPGEKGAPATGSAKAGSAQRAD